MSTSTYGKVRVEIIDRNGVRTSRWVNRQQTLTEAATKRGGMIAQFRTDATGRTTVTENGEVVGYYDPQPREMPGLSNIDAIQRDLEHRQQMQLYLKAPNQWISVQSSHDGPIPNTVLGVNEYWLFGIKADSYEQWLAWKRQAPSEVIKARYRNIVKFGEVRVEHPRLDDQADVGLSDS